MPKDLREIIAQIDLSHLHDKTLVQRLFFDTLKTVKFSPKEWEKFIDDNIEHTTWLVNRHQDMDSKKRDDYVHLLHVMKDLKKKLQKKGVFDDNEQRFSIRA